MELLELRVCLTRSFLRPQEAEEDLDCVCWVCCYRQCEMMGGGLPLTYLTVRCWTAPKALPVPVIWVCFYVQEDGVAIQTECPPRAVESPPWALLQQLGGRSQCLWDRGVV